MIGQTLGHYRIVEKIGQGGMGMVYRARDERLERDVALKVLPAGLFAEESERRRFRNEALTLSRLNHANIAMVHDFDTQDGVDFVVMELITGTTLGERLRSGPLPEKEVIRLGTQVAAALEEAHAQGVIHRDLKPGNIMVTPKGQVKVLDFGLAKMVQGKGDLEVTTSMTAMQGPMGTLPYMSPEQVHGDPVDARTDVWAAGVVLYEMATGQRPFPESYSPRLIDDILHKEPAPPRQLNPRLSPPLESIILKALDKDPAHRYQSAEELRIDHERLAISQPVTAAIPLIRRRRRKKLLIMTAAAAVILLAAGLSFRFWRPGAPAAVRQAVLVGDFENRTGEAVFDDTLREMLSISLQQSRLVSVFPKSRILEVLRRMERTGRVTIDESVGLEICQREGLNAVLLGSISRMGNSYVLIGRAVSSSGQPLVSAQEVVADAGQVPSALDAIVQKLRTGLGESQSSVREHSAPLAQVTSGSLEAVRYYTLGRERLYAGDPREAIRMFEQALQLDSKFAMAHEYLGAAYSIGNPARAEQHFHDASLLVDKVTESEKLKILGDYNYIIGQYEKAIGYYQALAELRPLDPAPHINLGLCYAGKFDFDSAVSATEKALQIQPYPRPRINLAIHHFMAGHTQKALEILQEVLRELPGDVEALGVLGQVQLMHEQLTEARQTFEAMARAGSDSEVLGRLGLADLLLATGRYTHARTELRRAIVVAEKSQNQFAATKARLMLAELALAGNHPAEYAAIVSGLEPDRTNPTLLFLLGRTHARGQRAADALRILQFLHDLAQKKDTPTLRSLESLLRSEIVLAQGDAASAVEAAEHAVQLENSSQAIETLARALAASGRDADALRQYELVLARANERSNAYDTPGFHRVMQTHYAVGLLYQKMGQANPARKHLEFFLKYAANPDPAAETYSDAKRRLAALR